MLKYSKPKLEVFKIRLVGESITCQNKDRTTDLHLPDRHGLADYLRTLPGHTVFYEGRRCQGEIVLENITKSRSW